MTPCSFKELARIFIFVTTIWDLENLKLCMYTQVFKIFITQWFFIIKKIIYSMDAEKVNPWRQVLQERKSWVGTKWSLNEFEMFFSPTKPILSQESRTAFYSRDYLPIGYSKFTFSLSPLFVAFESIIPCNLANKLNKITQHYQLCFPDSDGREGNSKGRSWNKW